MNKAYSRTVCNGALLFLAALAASACGTTEETVSEDSDADLLSAGTVFQMYDSLTGTVSPSCDKHLKVRISGTAARYQLNVENRVTGGCEILVVANPRVLATTTRSRDICASTTYRSTAGVSPAVELVDHRRRTCSDGKPLLELHVGTGATRENWYVRRPAVATALTGVAYPREIAKLYASRSHVVNPTCDGYTELVLGAAAAGATRRSATLTQRLSSTSSCEIFISPNARTFALNIAPADTCNSVKFTGAGLSVQDNRQRSCEDLRAKIEVIEGAESSGTRFYSIP